MRENGLEARQKRRFVHTTNSRHAHPIAPNLLDRDFDPKAANTAWAGDVTYIATGEGWLYLAVLLDLFSRRVVGWATSAVNDRQLALEALSLSRSRRYALSATICAPGRKLGRSSPYEWSCWVHCASLTSVLRPGTFFASRALTSTTSRPRASRISNSGIQ